MALNKDRITAAAMATLKAAGFKPDDVPFKDTGKSAAEIIVDAVAEAVVNEFKTNGVVSTSVSTTVAAPIPVQVVVATGTGATTATGSGTGSGTGGIA